MIERRSSSARRRYHGDLEILGPTQHLLADRLTHEPGGKPSLARPADDDAADIARAGEVEDRVGDIRSPH